MIHITKVRPLYTSVVTTGDRFEKDMTEGGLIVAAKGDLKLWQTVVAVGDSVRSVSPGDKVMISLENYAVRRYDKNSLQNDLSNNRTVAYNLRWITIDGEDGKPRECLLLTDRDILYAFEGGESESPVIDIPAAGLILPEGVTTGGAA